MVVTPSACMAWNREAEEWVLEAVHPGSSVEEVKDNTGFDLQVSPKLKVTPPPTEEELHVLRTVVRKKMEGMYPKFAREKICADD
jgi:glutaconate CoA-transferase subunit B